MARHYRFFLRNQDNSSLLKNKEGFRLSESSEPEIVFQLVKVLRVKPGDMVTLVPEGQRETFYDYDFEVTAASKNGLDLVQKRVRENKNELGFPLELLLCLPNKPDKLEFILQKAVEIGANMIELFESDFSQMKHQLRPDRLEKIIIEAAEQSERAVVPKLAMKGVLTKALTSAGPEELKRMWVAMERLTQDKSEHKGNPFIDAKKQDGISILVGPEGGFSEQEKELMSRLSLQKFSLGKRVLRMETAAVISLGLAALADEPAGSQAGS